MKIVRLILLASLAMVAAASLPAQTRADAATVPLGLAVRAQKAHIGDNPLTEGSTIYSGDYLSTEDGGSLLVRIGDLSLELQASSSAHIYRAPYGAVAELDRGTALYTTPGGHENLVIVASDVRVTPLITAAGVGRVTLDNPCNVTVAVQRGQADVKAGPETRAIAEGKTYRVRAENEINYRQYVSPDIDQYHEYHTHTPCAPVEMVKGHGPIAPGQSRFLLVAAGAAAGLTTWGTWKAMESPSRP